MRFYNACHSNELSEALSEKINYCIGINGEYSNDEAILFSVGFYRALGYKCSLNECFDSGKIEIQHKGFEGYSKPILYTKKDANHE